MRWAKRIKTSHEWLRIAAWTAARCGQGPRTPEHDDFVSVAVVGIAEAWAAVGRPETHETFAGLAFRAARMAIATEYKWRSRIKRNCVQSEPMDLDGIASFGRRIEDALDDRDQVERLLSLVHPSRREIVRRWMTGESASESAAGLGVSKTLVGNRVRESLARIKRSAAKGVRA